jgi:hypothetical protein
MQRIIASCGNAVRVDKRLQDMQSVRANGLETVQPSGLVAPAMHARSSRSQRADGRRNELYREQDTENLVMVDRRVAEVLRGCPDVPDTDDPIREMVVSSEEIKQREMSALEEAQRDVQRCARKGISRRLQ